jgi:FdhD protein
MVRIVEVAIERSRDGARAAAIDRVVVEAPLQLRARGVPVATIMRTPGHDLELVRGLLHAESVKAGEVTQADEDAVEIACEPAAFAGRGLLASAACGVCGRVAIADLELRATSVTSDAAIPLTVLAELPEKLRTGQALFEETGGLHAAALFTLAGERIALREDVGRHNAVDKLVGWALAARLAGYELVQKAIMFGIPIVASVSAPSSLAIELAERFNVALVGFVRGNRANVYAHGWRLLGS